LSRDRSESSSRDRSESSSRDRQRNRVYEAEQVVYRMFERANRVDADPTIELHGSRITLPIERRFASVASVQSYLDSVLAMRWLREAWPRAAVAVTVRKRAGHAAAHYSSATAEIAVPQSRAGRWAMRELVVLHELAHHLGTEDSRTDGDDHGPGFAGRFTTLAGELIGPEAGFLLTVSFRENGVAIG
jgi:putative metallohydrolase (TIGR04338 family)